MLDEFLQSLKTFSEDGNFQSVTASKYREESIQNAFITGLVTFDPPEVIGE